MSPHLSATVDLSSYWSNVSLSHRDWQLSVSTLEPRTELVHAQPLRRMRLEHDDLVLEFGGAPGRARRLTLTGPLEFAPARAGRALEIRLDGPRGARHALRLDPPQLG